LAKTEATELPLDRFPLGDLGEFITLVRRLEHVPNFLGVTPQVSISCYDGRFILISDAQ
jgi:hypothetical protein